MHIIRTADPVGPFQLSRRAGVSIKSLRYYESKGILNPTRSANGWRVYDAEDIDRLEQALELRNMGFGISEIAVLLDAEPDAMAAALASQDERLCQQRQDVERSLTNVRRARENLDRPALPGAAPGETACAA